MAMRFILLLVLVVFAAIGVAAVVDFIPLYDVPVIDVVKQIDPD